MSAVTAPSRVLRRSAWVVTSGVLAWLLTACSSGPEKPKPTQLAPVAALIGTTLAWSSQVGSSHAMLAPRAVAGRVFAAGASGTVVALDAATGKDLWRLNLGQPLAAGVGSDGQMAAVITQGNDLVAISDGKEVWRVRLPARSFTAPLVAGKRVFVLTADRTVRAFDGLTGARLWVQSRPAEPLVLSQAGALLAVGDTLVAGLAGRLFGLNPLNGSVRWDVPVATSRGANEVERLVDVVGPASRVGNSVCVRAYSAAVGCIDATLGTVAWTRPAQGATGLHGDDRWVFGAEADGRVRAWQRSSGEPGWEVDRLKYRVLTAPLAVGRVVAIGDNQGVVHLLSREDGSEMTRMTADGSAILVAPLLAGDALVVQTRNGGVYAWRPQ
ncbi:MAG: outer membrane protein assembly factor BamB [Hydrogenophaga sp.]|uniref:outer membrane protein assembly factor BamB n=1 Tax=Hydrogenophaga sp. TaxID=1904254 RepID=UPI0027479839|nr:outer membrane protein assembly factor BamB [Hydrogenophaga sp.]MDP2417757.1 outer membrane protein assembly factor BamB [Hydrogenophaga sp.]MDZ4189544.1 outer membrane protein assembly factor BamB [Hydrogenophaga sp.]